MNSVLLIIDSKYRELEFTIWEMKLEKIILGLLLRF